MSDTNPLLEFYQQLLISIDCIVTDDYKILYKIADSDTTADIFVKIDGKKKRLVFPSTSKLKTIDTSQEVLFHPLSESVIRGESEVFKILKRQIGLKLYEAVTKTLQELANIAGSDININNIVSSGYFKRMSRFMEFSSTGFKYIQKIAKTTTGIVGKKPLFTLRTQRGGTIEDKKYNRIAKIIPVILDEDDPIYNAKGISQKNQQSVRHMLEFLFNIDTYEDVDTSPTLIVGSNNKKAPYLHSLLTLFYNFGRHLNRIAEELHKIDTDFNPIINLGFSSYLDEDWEELYNYLPQSYEGNIGLPMQRKQADNNVQFNQAIPQTTHTSQAPSVSQPTLQPPVSNTPPTYPQQTPVQGSLTERLRKRATGPQIGPTGPVPTIPNTQVPLQPQGPYNASMSLTERLRNHPVSPQLQVPMPSPMQSPVQQPLQVPGLGGLNLQVPNTDNPLDIKKF